MDERQQYPVLWPGWETVRLIGRGSYGAVYEIRRPLGNTWEYAAVKHIQIPPDEGEVERLRSEGYDDGSITQRFAGYLQDFMQEYSLMARMKGCANIVYCDDVRHIQTDDGLGWNLYIKMELLTPLTKSLDAVHAEEQAIQMGKDLCRALIFFEKQRVLHRDIKPQNIFVSADGTYKLGDFGVARTLEGSGSASMRTGTERYMAPEVYQSTHYDARADQYSLGLVLYWLLNERRLPFLPLPPQVPSRREEEQAQSRRMKGETLPAPENGSVALKRIVLRACAYDPEERYASAEEMLRELEQLGTRRVPRPQAEEEPQPWTEHQDEPTQDETLSGYEKDAFPAALEEEKNKTLGVGFGQQGRIPVSQEEDLKTLGAGPGRDRKEKTEENRAEGKPPQPVKENKEEKKESHQPKKSRGKLFALLGVGAAALILLLVLLPKGGKKPAAPTPAATRVPVSMSTPAPAPTAEPTPEPTPAPTPEPTTEPTREERGFQKLAGGEIYWKVEDGLLILEGEGPLCNLGKDEYDWRKDESITGIEVREGITALNDYAFSQMQNVKTVQLPGSLTEIGGWAFSECSSLEEISIPDGVTRTGKGVFEKCSGLRTAELSDGLTEIADSVFHGCTGLESISIPEGVTEIGMYAFSGCSKLATVKLPSSLRDIQKSAFHTCSELSTLTIPSGVTTIGESAFSWCQKLETVTIPESVITMREHAFDHCSSLHSVTIPGSVGRIKMSCFSSCDSLTQLSIGEGVTDIERNAFFGCGSLKTVDLPDTLTRIGESSFDSCGLESIRLPKNVETVADDAFAACIHLRSVRIPVKLTCIRNGAFKRCDALKDVYYEGSEAQWKRITIEEGNYKLTGELTGAAIHYNEY